MTACTFREVSPPSRRLSGDNLLSVLERAGLVRDRGDGTWIGGVQFRPENCGGGGIHVDNCASGVEESGGSGDVSGCAEKVFNSFHEAVKWRSMNVFSSVSCSTFSDQPDVRDEATRSFIISKPAIVAFELYYGQANKLETVGELCDDGSPFPQNPFIADPAQLFPSGTDTADWTTAVVLDPVAGLALINDTIATYALGAESVIHTTPGMATIWLSHDLIDRDDSGNFRTRVGNHLVIAAPGYYGSTPYDPNGDSPGRLYDNIAWTYVTGPMGLYLGDEHSSDSLDQRRNNYFTVVEQFVLPFFDPTCPRFAVPIGQDCASLEVDFTIGGTPVTRILNDHYLECVPPESGAPEGEAIDPAVFIGIDYA